MSGPDRRLTRGRNRWRPGPDPAYPSPARDQQPLQLRTLQTVEAGGATVVLGAGAVDPASGLRPGN
jgi:hypothetical protein